MELIRAQVDYGVIKFIKNNLLYKTDFVMTNSGEVRLNPEMAGLVVLNCQLKYLHVLEHVKRFIEVLLKS
jgi:hypothetical protein